MLFPKKQNITFPEDLDSSAHVYYAPIMGHFYQRKLELLCHFLDGQQERRVLEIGFGSGMALTELSRRFEKVDALDIHDHFKEVEDMLQREGIKNVSLFQHNIFERSFADEGWYDCVFSSSVFEHIPESIMEEGIRNIAQCLTRDGHLLIGFPLKTSAMDGLFKLYEHTFKRLRKNAYDFSSEKDHVSGEKEIIPRLEKYFTIEDQKYYFNNFVKLYTVLKCKKRATL